jgi:AcrR family transcriptional regulator
VIDDDENETGLPASIEAAWGLRDRATKGPKPGLTLGRIVKAAVKVADAEGLAAVSMARVATELGASTMSLYRYVAAKDELLALMVDAALGAPPPAADPEDWRAGLMRWAWAQRAAFQRHPWALRVPVGPASTPNQTAWIEDGLRAQGDTALAEAEKLSVLLLVSGYVRNVANMDADIGAAVRDDQEVMPTWARQLERLTDAERFPALRAALASGAFDQDDDPDDEFVFGLERILDGIEALVVSRRPGPAA